MVALLSNLVLLVVDLAALVRLSRGRDGDAVVRSVTFLAAGSLVLVVAGSGLGWGSFALAQALCWAFFLHGPLLAAAAAWFVPRWRRPLVALALTGAVVSVDAFLLEPRRLEVTSTALPGPRLRIALVADLQTDHVGDHERAALEAVAAAEPDLVLFAGDYLQIRGEATYAREAEALRGLLSTLHPRLGGYAVRGDIDRDTWAALFDGTAITAVPTSRTFDLSVDGVPVSVTALSPADAASGRPPIPPRDGFHVVLAHRPDFSLTRPDADLLLAGHVHGGQVRLPWFGREGLLPLVTLSKVSREEAVGLTALPSGGHLYVSRGVGMERYDAPRLRFLCPPEVAILELGSEG